MMYTVLRFRIAIALGVVTVSAGGAANAQVMRFLPNFLDYGTNLTNYDQPVVDNVTGQNVGTIKFDYNTHGFAYGTGKTKLVGGGILSGGFFQAATPIGLGLQSGYTLGWMQTVITTIPGNNAWNAAAGAEFPDTVNKSSPIYPFNTAAVTPPGMVPISGFNDMPTRFTMDGNQSWLGELGLVAYNSQTHNVHVLETLLWGFGIVNNAPAMATIANSVTPNPPSLWSAPTSSYMATERNSFTGLNGSTLWTFDQNQAFFTPEPGSIALAGGMGVTCFAWRRRRRKPRK